MTTERLYRALDAYEQAFPGMYAPAPFGITDDALAEVLEQAVANKQPIPEDFDFWDDLPPDAVA